MKKIMVKSYTLSVLSLALCMTAPLAFAQTGVNHNKVEYGKKLPDGNFGNSWDSTAIPGQEAGTTGNVSGTIGAQPTENNLRFQRNATCTLKGATVECPKYDIEPTTPTSVSKPWRQQYDYQWVNNCGDGLQVVSTTSPDGQVGNGSIYARKAYLPPEGSSEVAVYEPWYLTKNGCQKKSPDNLTPGQATDVTIMVNNDASAFVNTMNNAGLNGNQAAQVQGIVNSATNQAKYNFATPTFNNIFSDENGSPAGIGGGRYYYGVAVCIWGESNNHEITVGGRDNGFGNITYNGPWPGWTPTRHYAGSQYVGYICPQGSGVVNFGDRGYSEPDKP